MKSAFTLIELLIVIAILGVLAAAILVAINPGKRNAQARDAIRRGQINAIANALIGYSTLHDGTFPSETNCDSSLGSSSTSVCSLASFSQPYDWDTTVNFIFDALVARESFFKSFPKDPINNTTYYYVYEPGSSADGSGNCAAIPCITYWIGTQLEAPIGANNIFRCSDKTGGNGPGCKEVSGTFGNGSLP